MISDIREALTDDGELYCNDIEDDDFVDVPIDAKYCNFPCDESALSYITGFVLHKFILRDSCRSCWSILVQEKHMDLT